MKLRFLSLIMFAVMLANHTSAQCPNTKTVTVAASLQPMGAQGCSIQSLQIGGVTIGVAGQNCPLLVIDTPAHELEVFAGADAGTQTRITGAVKEWTYFFRCKPVWYVIIPWGSSCELDQKILRNTLHRRSTVSC